MKLSTELGFDSEAAFKKATYYAEKYGTGCNSFEIIYAFKAGAFWQHLQDSAALSAMKSELGQRSQATIDKAIAASKLFSDKPSIFADVEFVDNGNNSYLKSKGAAQTMALHILEEQIDKLRAENAILREGLKFYADVDNWENPCVINDPDLKAQKALTAADKVRGEG